MKARAEVLRREKVQLLRILKMFASFRPLKKSQIKSFLVASWLTSYGFAVLIDLNLMNHVHMHNCIALAPEEPFQRERPHTAAKWLLEASKARPSRAKDIECSFS